MGSRIAKDSIKKPKIASIPPKIISGTTIHNHKTLINNDKIPKLSNGEIIIGNDIN